MSSTKQQKKGFSFSSHKITIVSIIYLEHFKPSSVFVGNDCKKNLQQKRDAKRKIGVSKQR